MTKVILVTSEGDNGVSEFEKSNVSVEEAYQIAKAKGGRTTIDLEDDTIAVKAYEFGEVDSKFISFIRDEIQYYNQTSYIDFFIVEEGVQ